MSKFEIIIAIVFLCSIAYMLYHFSYILWIGMSRALFGKFSYRYYSVLKKQSKKHLLVPVRSSFISFFHDYFNPGNIATFHTETPVVFGNTNFGASTAEILAEIKHYDRFKVDQVGDKSGLILGLKPKKKGQQETQYFFLDNQFLLGQYKFKHISEIDALNIKTNILEYYKLDTNSPINHFMINDPENHTLEFLFNGYSLYIKHFGITNPELTELLKTIESNPHGIDLNPSKSTDAPCESVADFLPGHRA
ncbi:MAG: hypothetical protein JEZ03_14965 [Bacteroidales bacterium]|nr:hypothetical protein [Bacteroidales bacterium]